LYTVIVEEILVYNYSLRKKGGKMSAVLEQYFQTVVVDKLDNMINKRFQEMKDDLDVLKKLKIDYTNLRIEIESLKKHISDSDNDIKEMLSKNGNKVVATKTAAKKPAVKKKVAAKKTAKK